MTIHNLELLKEEEKPIIIMLGEAWKNYWKSITVAWYSDGSRNLVIETKEGQFCSEDINTYLHS